MCVRKEKFIESALQAIEKEDTNDFKYRCSFFLQKLRDDNIDTAINKSIAEGGKKKSSITTPTSSSTSTTKAATTTANVVTPKKGVTIDGLLAAFNKKLEFHQHTLQMEAAVAMEKRKKAKAVQEELAAKKGKINAKGSNDASKKVKLAQQHQKSEQQNHRAALTKPSLRKIPSSEIRNPAASTPHILYQQQNYQANQMPNMVMDFQGKFYYNNNQKNPLFGSQKMAKNNQNKATSKLPVRKGETRLIGPKTPVNLHDFPTTHNHREPALNLDGLVHSVKLPATRSKIATVSSSNDTKKTHNMSNGETTKFKHEPLNDPKESNNRSTSKAAENVFFHIENNGTHVERVQLDDPHDKNRTTIAEKIDEDGSGKNATSLTANSTSASSTKNSTSTPDDLKTTGSSLSNNSNTTAMLLDNKTEEAMTTANATKYGKNSTLKAGQLNATKIGEIMVSNKNETALKPDQKNTTTLQNVIANLVNNSTNNKTANEQPINSTTDSASILDDKKKLNSTENAPLTKTLDRGLPQHNISSINKLSNSSSSLELVNNSTKSNTTAADLTTVSNNTANLNKNQTSGTPDKNTTTAAAQLQHMELHPQNSTVTNATSRNSILDHKAQEHNFAKLHTNKSSTDSMKIKPKGFLATSLVSSSPANTTFDLMPEDTSNSKDVAGGKKSHDAEKVERSHFHETDEANKRNSTSSEEEQDSDSQQAQQDNSNNNKKNTTIDAVIEEENKNSTLTDTGEDKKNTTTIASNLDSATDAKLNNESSTPTVNITDGVLNNSTTAKQTPSSLKQNETTSDEVEALVKNTTSTTTPENLSANGTISSTNKSIATDNHSLGYMKNTTTTTSSLTNNTVNQNQTLSKLNQTHQAKDQLIASPQHQLQQQQLAMMQQQQGRFSPMEDRQRMMMMNSSISYDRNGAGGPPVDGLARDVNAAYANNTGGYDSPDEQNAMLMQSVQGAVRRINEDDVRMVSQKMRALEKEDRTTAPSMERILAGDTNPHVQNLLLGGYGVNQTLGFSNNTASGPLGPGYGGGPGGMEGDEAYSRSDMEMNSQQLPQYLVNSTAEEENGDARSHLYKPKKGFMMPAVSRDQVTGDGHHVLENHDLRNDFHQKADELSHTDKDRYNELNHAESGSELHHYHNNDAMHPPTIQHSEQINDLHHLSHGYMNDDPMTPPEHRLPQDYYHEWIHHGEPHDYPANQDAAYIKHIATDHGTDGKKIINMKLYI